MLLSFLTITEYRPDDLEMIEVINNVTELVRVNEPLRFMTFNIGYAGLGATEDFVLDGGEKGRSDSLSVVEVFLAGIINVILDEQPIDFYLMQEVDYFGEDFVLGFDPILPTCRLLHQPFVPSDAEFIYDPDNPETQFYIIDGFIVSNNVQIEVVYTVDQAFKYSDHNPVVIEVILLED